MNASLSLDLMLPVAAGRTGQGAPGAAVGDSPNGAAPEKTADFEAVLALVPPMPPAPQVLVAPAAFAPLAATPAPPPPAEASAAAAMAERNPGKDLPPGNGAGQALAASPITLAALLRPGAAAPVQAGAAAATLPAGPGAASLAVAAAPGPAAPLPPPGAPGASTAPVPAATELPPDAGTGGAALPAQPAASGMARSNAPRHAARAGADQPPPQSAPLAGRSIAPAMKLGVTEPAQPAPPLAPGAAAQGAAAASLAEGLPLSPAPSPRAPRSQPAPATATQLALRAADPAGVPLSFTDNAGPAAPPPSAAPPAPAPPAGADLFAVIDRLLSVRGEDGGESAARIELAHPDFGRVTLALGLESGTALALDMPEAPAELRQAVSFAFAAAPKGDRGETLGPGAAGADAGSGAAAGAGGRAEGDGARPFAGQQRQPGEGGERQPVPPRAGAAPPADGERRPAAAPRGVMA